MLATYLVVTVCSDASNIDLIRYQNQCMQKVIQFSKEDTRVDEYLADICLLDGVTCSDGFVRHIRWVKPFPHKVISIDWFPMTTSEISMGRIEINRIMHVRRFPRNLQRFLANNCQLSGKVDLCSLPDLMIEFNVRGNFCTGALDFTNLPPTMKLIDVTFNEFDTLIVCNAKLPSILVEIKAFANPYLKNKVILDARNPDQRVRIKGY